MKTRAVLLALCLCVLSACADRLSAPSPGNNSAPSVELSPGSNSTNVHWEGSDPDGRVVHYLYAIDPPTDGSLIEWTRTEQTRLALSGGGALAERRDPFRRVAIRAVDDDGAASEILEGALFENTIAPLIQITSPRPSVLFSTQVPETFRVRWQGVDPDGDDDKLEYRWILLSPSSEFPIPLALANPDSVRRFYAPEFNGWESTVDTEVVLKDLSVSVEYVFIVVAIDEAGAYTPIFSLNTNMLRFRVFPSEVLGPRITIWNEAFYFRSIVGGWQTDVAVFLEHPEGSPIDFSWFATAQAGADVVGYRWALDIKDVNDETVRKDKDDLAHWSELGNETIATVGPFKGGETHRFYLQAVDEFGSRSLLIVEIQVVGALLDRPLLIVDDTRLLGDQIPSGSACTRPPTGEWPTAAELDTFLFARGNAPWRCYPEGTMSSPGLFAGYAFDTLGTRNGALDASVRLETLTRYRHVVWLVDARGANNTNAGSDPFAPITSLRYMSGPGQNNSLAAYVRAGGSAWLAGGGGALATLAPWDDVNNNGPTGSVFSSNLHELGPGRFMYDIACWQSEITVSRAPVIVQRTTRAPSSLPVLIHAKSPATDPLPPGRDGQTMQFYKSIFDFEYLSAPNVCAEKTNAGEVSVLDSLYKATTFSLPPTELSRVCMTHYRGNQSGAFTFTGFSIWDFAREDCQALVDYVLGGLWSLPKAATTRGSRPSIRPVPVAPVTFDGRGRIQRPLGR